MLPIFIVYCKYKCIGMYGKLMQSFIMVKGLKSTRFGSLSITVPVSVSNGFSYYSAVPSSPNSPWEQIKFEIVLRLSGYHWLCFFHLGYCCWRACRAIWSDVNCWDSCWTARAQRNLLCPYHSVSCFTLWKPAFLRRTLRWRPALAFHLHRT